MHSALFKIFGAKMSHAKRYFRLNKAQLAHIGSLDQTTRNRSRFLRFKLFWYNNDHLDQVEMDKRRGIARGLKFA